MTRILLSPSGHFRQAVAAAPEAADVVDRLSEASGFLLDILKGIVLGTSEELLVAEQVGDAEVEEAVLAGAEELAGAALLEVKLGELEAVLGSTEGLQALVGHFADLLRGEQVTVGGVAAAADAAAQLVELGPTSTTLVATRI
jgi:hypothetical protein